MTNIDDIGPGHNSGAEVLRSIVGRIERIEEKIADLNTLKSSIYRNVPPGVTSGIRWRSATDGKHLTGRRRVRASSIRLRASSSV